jgi:hypothetical protein
MKSVIAGSSFTGWVFAMQATDVKPPATAVLLSRLPQMRVHVEEAGRNPPPVGLDDLRPVGIETRAHRCDLAVLDEHVAGLVPVRRRVEDAPSTDQDSTHNTPPLDGCDRRPASR